jgi:RNA polymerase sigma-70 factor (ECF subfamily)
LYLIFNEGYVVTEGDDLMRADLCAEGIRLGRVLVERLRADAVGPPLAEARGLLALMLLHHARRRARLSEAGEFVSLDDQDRSRWDAALIEEGTALLEEALSQRRPGPYQIQAAISALHARAPSAAETDWLQIAALYGELERRHPSPVVGLNRAVAVGMAFGPEEGLRLLETLGAEGALDGYQPYHAARADMLARAGRKDDARWALARALDLAGNEVERRHLRRRLAELPPEEDNDERQPGQGK